MTTTTFDGAFVAMFCSAALCAQAASFTPFGSGCTFQGQALSIGNRGLPVLGTTFTIDYTGPNFTFSSGQQIAHPVLVLGFGQQTVPLPVGLLPQQPAGCTALITTDAFLPTAANPTQPVFDASIPFVVPNQPTLAGFAFFAQWVCLVEQCGFAGCGFSAVPTSDAAVVSLGF